jgi:hypothetical protein
MHFIRDVALAVLVAAIGLLDALPAAAANYDGYWSLVARTTKGHCGVTRWDVSISGGRLYYSGGFFMGFPVGITGVVSPSGRVQVNVMAGPRVGTGGGRLAGSRGSGTWGGQGPSGTCSGVWTATRIRGYAPAYGVGGGWFWPPAYVAPGR